MFRGQRLSPLSLAFYALVFFPDEDLEDGVNIQVMWYLSSFREIGTYWPVPVLLPVYFGLAARDFTRHFVRVSANVAIGGRLVED